MTRSRLLTNLLLVAGLTWPLPAEAQSNCFEGVQASGSIYRICLPPQGSYFNGGLVIWAHGFQDATEPVQIPEDQLLLGDVYLPDLLNSLGFAFATNSYSKTGLAIVQGRDDILDLVEIYRDTVGRPRRIYLTGASEGGIITTLLVEQYPDVFDGGLAACGPIGDFPAQINYFGDARATFEYYFPGLIPGDPFNPDQWLVDVWSGAGGYYETYVEPVLLNPANAPARDEWARVSRLPYDPNDYEPTLMTSIRDVLNYAVVNLNDAAATLGGFPFDNSRTWYRGASDPAGLNSTVPRAGADPAALMEMQRNYTTSGVLRRPLMTMHTLLDQQVPYWHEPLYTQKNLQSNSFVSQRLNLPVNRYGHCNFTAEEALFMFTLLLYYNGDVSMILPTLNGLATVDAQGNVRLESPERFGQAIRRLDAAQRKPVPTFISGLNDAPIASQPSIRKVTPIPGRPGSLGRRSSVD